jgi:bifunctional DNA-binding transcriptional regulator/antitoxin component of YhaV-PrlF toxin-antitoxin module
MKLQRQKAYEYKGKTKYKWVIVIPSEDIEKLGWKEGMELEGVAEKDKGYFLFINNS